MSGIVVMALYKFCDLPDYEEQCDIFAALCQEKQIKGTLIFSHEGVNGTVAGQRSAVSKLMETFLQDKRFIGMECKESFCEEQPFLRLKLKTKNEIDQFLL